MSSTTLGPALGSATTMSRPGSRLDSHARFDPRSDSRFDSRFEPTRPSSRPSSRASARRPSTAALHTPAHDAVPDPNRVRPQSRQSRQSRPPLPDPAAEDSPQSGKRKRDASCAAADDGLLKPPIVLKPHPSTLTMKPRILHPLMLLPREHLQLSALDLSQPQGDFPASRLFESKIKILDLEGRLGSNVLLARSETSRMVYAVERESNGLYVLCKLGSWADVDGLARNATVVCRQRMRGAKPAKPENAAPVPLTTPAMYNENKRRRLAIDEIQSLVRKRSMSVIDKDAASQAALPAEEHPKDEADQSHNTTPVQENVETPPAESGPSVSSDRGVPTPSPAPMEDANAPPDANDIFQNIRAQYMEALYHSKGSLAYFAKGPLSRARAAFHLDWDSNLDMNDLVEFLKTLVMTTVVIDKKYRETLPEIVARMKSLVMDSENGTPKPKKKKPKKLRLGKDGLYPGEIDHIRRWWASHQPVSTLDDEKRFTAVEHKYHISCLRRRETQLQMILILEILALEPLALSKGAECQLPGMESQAASREPSQEPAVKKRNKHNLPVLLDVHADRLCIWQSTTLDEVKAVAESQMPVEGAEGEKPDRANADPLRDFCVDIIVPFFSARLPAPCDSLNRKLGGPVAHSPPKEKAAKPASTKPKPGAPLKRPTALKRDKDRALERALSVERSRRSVSRGPAAAIALLRSASQTVIPGLKREASESSLMGLIPRPEPGSLKERPTNLFARSASLTGAVDLKAQKKAKVEAELQDAISALKKPNRALAVKDFVDAAEKRASAGQLKKMKKPNRASAVQVKATPANNRYKDALAAAAQLDSPSLPLDLPPPSSASVVPASTPPRKFANRLPAFPPPPPATAPTGTSRRVVEATPARAGAVVGRGVVRATPARRPVSSTAADPTSTPAPAIHLPSSPLMARKAPPPRFSLPQQQQSQQNRLAPPQNQQHVMLPSSPPPGAFAAGEVEVGTPMLAGLFETPVARGQQRERVDDTPIRVRLPLGAVGDGGMNRNGFGRVGGVVGRGSSNTGNGKNIGVGAGASNSPSGSERDVEENNSRGEGGGNGNGKGLAEVSIYQRLGWETTDLDDIDDLL